MITRRGVLSSGVASGAALFAPGAWTAEPQAGLYLPGLETAEKAFRDSEDRQVQALAALRAAVGDEAGALAAWAERNPKPPTPAVVDVSDATAEAALPAILTAARGRRVVMINEAHHVSRCRAFGATVARALRGEGFDILAAEAFISIPELRFDDSMAAGEAVTFQAGGYVRDPVFAELMRQSRADGYRLMAYEAYGPALGTTREASQAAALEAILKANPDSRLLVYCGYGHLAEVQLGAAPWMATRLKASTGIDPLTIDQSFGIPAPRSDQEAPLTGAVLDHFKPTAPIIVRRADGSGLGGTLERAVDMTVFHPRLADMDGRPGWLAKAPDRQRRVFALPKGLAAGGLIQAVPLAEASARGVVPADQYRVPAGANQAVFFLRPGAYEVRLETAAGRKVIGKL